MLLSSYNQGTFAVMVVGIAADSRDYTFIYSDSGSGSGSGNYFQC